MFVVFVVVSCEIYFFFFLIVGGSIVYGVLRGVYFKVVIGVYVDVVGWWWW